MSAQKDTGATVSASRQYLKFLLAGGIAALVNWLSRFAFSEFMSLGFAVVAAYLVGMTTAFVLNRAYVFDRSGRAIHSEYTRFAIVNLVAIVQVWLVTLGLAEFLFPAVGMTWHAEAIAHAVGVATPVVTSYFGHRHFTFAPAGPRAGAPATGASPDPSASRGGRLPGE